MITVTLSNFPVHPLETSKAYERRLREDFFLKYCQGKGIDIGAGRDPIMDGVDAWDQQYGDGDAELMEGIPDATYDWVYASHIIEHVWNAERAIQNWFRILKPGGYLILFGPERDLYEKRTRLPSRWNPDHKTFWKLMITEPPNTFSIVQVATTALWNLKKVLGTPSIPTSNLNWYSGAGLPSGPHFAFEYAKVCNKHWQPCAEDVHSGGEYSFETVIKKLA